MEELGRKLCDERCQGLVHLVACPLLSQLLSVSLCWPRLLLAQPQRRLGAKDESVKHVAANVWGGSEWRWGHRKKTWQASGGNRAKMRARVGDG